MPIPLAVAVGIGQSAIGGFANAFNKDRYKTEYHYGTQDLKKQNKELKKLLEQAKKMPVQQQAKTSVLPVAEQPQTEQNNSMKNIGKIGVVIIVAVVGVVGWLLMRKPKNKQLK